MSHIDWRSVRREMLLGFAAWGTLSLFFYSNSYLSYTTQLQPRFTWEQAWLRVLAETVFDALLWTVYTPVILALARRFPVQRAVLRRNLAIHAAAGLLLASAAVVLNFLVARYTYLYGPFWPRFYWVSLHYALLSYAAVVAAGHALEIYRRFRDREMRASQLEGQLARARLHALEMQLQPHFLFNTLNSISELVHDDPGAAEVMIAQLGDLLRMTTDRAGREEVPLARELELVGTYLEIERTRFQDRLSVKTEVDADVMDAMVPNLVLQPLVENAVRHGLSPQVAPGTVTLAARRVGDVLRLTVRDDGRGLPPRGERRERVGVGNTRSRLTQAYGAAHRFELADAPGGGTLVTIEIPYRPAGPDEAPVTRGGTLAGATA
ncbi:MAG TPA: histidine kinase [Longimicrobium sp.]|nr:histidine kinase [Longimicrobium sp.]